MCGLLCQRIWIQKSEGDDQLGCSDDSMKSDSNWLTPFSEVFFFSCLAKSSHTHKTLTSFPLNFSILHASPPHPYSPDSSPCFVYNWKIVEKRWFHYCEDSFIFYYYWIFCTQHKLSIYLAITIYLHFYLYLSIYISLYLYLYTPSFALSPSLSPQIISILLFTLLYQGSRCSIYGHSLSILSWNELTLSDQETSILTLNEKKLGTAKKKRRE